MAETSKQVSPSIWSINIDHENQLVASWHSCFGYFTIFAIYINLKYNANLCSRRQRCFSELNAPKWNTYSKLILNGIDLLAIFHYIATSNWSCPIKKLRLYHVSMHEIYREISAFTSYLIQRVIRIKSCGWFGSRNTRVATRN